jgi:pyruvate dehydrogenase E2 component (dihydrolipoamide acetyltransferase)
MAIDVTMPKLSDTMEEGKILRWIKQVGDAVRIGDVLAEVETDKANMELEAYDEGVLAEVRVGEDESAPVGAVIAVLAEPGEARPAPAAGREAEAGGTGAPHPGAREEPPARPGPEREAAEGAGAAPGAKAAEPAPGAKKPAARDAAGEARRPSAVRRPDGREAPREVRASPLARRIAEEHGLDLRRVTGSGPGGRIVEQDVRAALGGAEREPETAEPQVALRAEARPVAAEARPAGRVELTRIRRTTAKRMGEAKREIPHFYASAEVAVEELERLKEALAARGGGYEGLTYTHLVLKAVGLALHRVPELNASYDGDAMILRESVNVGLATAVDDGLLLPVVRGCDREPLATIVERTRGLVERARAGRFAADDLVGATFTVSNLGMFPVTEFAAIINPPQAAILAVGAMRDVPVVRDGHVVAGRRMTVTLSCDHRIIDGVLAGRFLRELKTLLESPLALVL